MSKPYYQTDRLSLYDGDCRIVLRDLSDCSVDSIVCDPPYELGFMGKGWDRSGIAYDVSVWSECLRVLKPGGHLLAFGGSRTYHRLACAIEDSGFEIRDQIQWIYGSGFPKSLDIGKQLDLQERDKWINVCKAIDNLDETAILEAWKEHSKTARHAAVRFAKKLTEIGTNTHSNGSAPAPALLSISLKKSDASAMLAELSLSEALRSFEGNGTIALANAAKAEELSPAESAASTHSTSDTVRCDVKESLNERRGQTIKADEALRTWLGRTKFSSEADTNALCAALAEDLKLTILNHSKTFRNSDIESQMECVSATTATITESTAASLISFMVATLKAKAIDAAAGAERKQGVKGRYADRRPNPPGASIFNGAGSPVSALITDPVTDAAKQWEGWGTALKPAHEPIVLARKPLISTVAQNILEYGTGGLNIDGCRIEGIKDTPASPRRAQQGAAYSDLGNDPATGTGWNANIGRWPSNIILDGSSEVTDLFPDTQPSTKLNCTQGARDNQSKGAERLRLRVEEGYLDSGSAARFFYCAKASQEDRNEGLEDLPMQSAGAVTDRKDGSAGLNSPGAGAGRNNGSRNPHPTVKPTDLMRYLCRLVTPPGGTVLDVFCGSGSTGKAAMLEGLKFIGIELSAEYCELAQRRIEAANKQGLLFTTA